MDDSESSSSGRGTSKSFTLYVLRSIALSPQPGWFEKLAAMEAAGVSDVKERHGARSLMPRNSTERLGGDYDLGLRGSAVSCTSLTRSEATFQASTSKCGIMLILKGWCFD